LDQCHKRRNLAEYEGHLDIDAQLLKELIVLAHELLDRVNGLGGIHEKSEPRKIIVEIRI
jgi:metal-dependent hydrolase (beta-lactamase superfamily II)